MGGYIRRIMEETQDFSDLVWKFPSGTFIFDQYMLSQFRQQARATVARKEHKNPAIYFGKFEW